MDIRQLARLTRWWSFHSTDYAVVADVGDGTQKKERLYDSTIVFWQGSLALEITHISNTYSAQVIRLLESLVTAQ